MGDVISPIVLSLLGLFFFLFHDIIITAALPQQVCLFSSCSLAKAIEAEAGEVDVFAAAYFIQDYCRRCLGRISGHREIGKFEH